MTHVLLVEDDKNLSFILKSSLEQMIGGYEIETASNGQEGLDKLAQRRFDVIVSDVEMPVMDGRTMVQHIRAHHPNVAIIFITGLTTARDVINGYQSGADFYIKKPFLPEELDAHIQAVLKVKQASMQSDEKPLSDVYQIGKYRFLPTQSCLIYEEAHQSLTAKEAKVLEMLCKQKGNIVNREEILTSIWGISDFYSSRSLDVFISKLRKYLAKDTGITLQVHKGIGISLQEHNDNG